MYICNVTISTQKTNNMKRLTLAIILACFTLTMAAQGVDIRVNYKGAKPTISDFAWAFLSSDNGDDDGCVDESFNAMKQVWIQHRKGLPLDEGETLTVDDKNGYICYESKDEEYVLRWEMCYWNYADGKHKLFAYNVTCFSNGKYSPGQFDGLLFYRYNNATKKLTECDDTGVDIVYRSVDNVLASYALPRVGKDITVTLWYDKGPKKKTLKWNGHGFNL